MGAQRDAPTLGNGTYGLVWMLAASLEISGDEISGLDTATDGTVFKQWALQFVSLEFRSFGGVVLFDTKTESYF